MEQDPRETRRDEATPASGADRPRFEPQSQAGAGVGDDEPLLEPKEADAFRTTWRAIQTDFVDHPKESVRAADSLVAEVMRTLAASFAAHKGELESQWGRGQDAATEDLRIALQHYRSFFNRLLST